MKRYAIAVLVSGSMFAAGPAKKKPAVPDIVATITPRSLSRTIQYDENDIPTIRTKVGYTTSLSLPDGEIIMGAISGDTELWKTEVPPGSNLSFIRPGKAGISTNLNLVTASNHVYPFLLVEGGGPPDLKVVMKVGNSMTKEISAPSKWVARTELDAFRKEVEQAKREAAEAKESGAKEVAATKTKAEQELADFRSKFPSSLKFDYVYSKDRRHNFAVQAMAHSDAFTYIYANPQETPVLYEIRDGKPTLLNFKFENGVFVADKVLDKGYLAIGKHKMTFKRDDE